MVQYETVTQKEESFMFICGKTNIKLFSTVFNYKGSNMEYISAALCKGLNLHVYSLGTVHQQF